MSRILTTMVEEDILRDCTTYGLDRPEEETLNQTSVRLAKAALNQVPDLDDDAVFKQVLVDCRSMTNDELNYYYLQQQFANHSRFITIRTILRVSE